MGEQREPAYVPITRPERELVRRSSALDSELEKNSPLDGAGAGPSMASDTPRGAAWVRLLDELKAFEFGQSAKS